jgi:hypothetical protein
VSTGAGIAIPSIAMSAYRFYIAGTCKLLCWWAIKVVSQVEVQKKLNKFRS